MKARNHEEARKPLVQEVKLAKEALEHKRKLYAERSPKWIQLQPIVELYEENLEDMQRQLLEFDQA
jgi:hypothetical protein